MAAPSVGIETGSCTMGSADLSWSGIYRVPRRTLLPLDWRILAIRGDLLPYGRGRSALQLDPSWIVC